MSVCHALQQCTLPSVAATCIQVFSSPESKTMFTLTSRVTCVLHITCCPTALRGTVLGTNSSTLRSWFAHFCCCSDMLGTVSDYSLREGHSSVAIIRSSAPKQAGGGHVYLFATDGSRAAAVAYCTLCHQ
eukprot:GHUV01044110.1.p1 GENE.GHUV01044110.1~~GHUV01044110.1.p1  ORF type:complete len:130 (-),score=31.08 GHUV01044110.1:80-469(-)